MSEWIDICAVNDVMPGTGKAFLIGDLALALFNTNGEFLALENRCSHADSAFIIEGLDPDTQLDGDKVRCPRHGAWFCMRTGAALTPPAIESTPAFETRVVDNRVQLARPEG